MSNVRAIAIVIGGVVIILAIILLLSLLQASREAEEPDTRDRLELDNEGDLDGETSSSVAPLPLTSDLFSA